MTPRSRGRSDTDKENLVRSFIEGNPDYELREPDGSVCEAECPQPLGIGGASLVFHGIYKGRLRRAVKLMSPRPDLREHTTVKVFLESFANEQALLSELNHENIASLVDFGTNSGTHAVPFVATQFVDGLTLDEFVSSKRHTRSDVFALLEQILKGLAYLHSMRVMHCDVKPANIRVRHGRDSSDFNAVLLDLGSARLIPTELSPAKAKSLTYFFSSPMYTLPRLIPLDGRRGNRIRWEELLGAFPQQDLYGLSIVMQLVASESASRLPKGAVQGLREIADRLRHEAYGSVEDVVGAFARLRGNSWSGWEHPEQLTGTAARRTVRTPLGLVGIDGYVREFVDHPLIQRQRRVPQSDLLSYVFPGATHSRFMHTLHTLELARSAVSRMSNEVSLSVDLSHELVNTFTVRALLSNVGHYQLLHVFEDFVDDRRRDGKVRASGILSSLELMSSAVSGAGATPSAWGAVADHKGRTLGDLVSDALGDPIASGAVFPLDSPVEALLAALISSPVDVAKMAYLRDDSLMTGMPFGRAISPDEVFKSLVRPNDEDLTGHEPVMGVRERALPHLEGIVLARYWQIQRGYWFKDNRSLQAMVRFMVSRLVFASSLDFSEYIHDTANSDWLGALLWISDRFERARADGRLSADIRNPIEDFLQSKRVIYSRALTLSPKTQAETRRDDESICRTLAKLTLLELDDLAEDIRAHLADELQVSTRPGDILVDIPRPRDQDSGRVVLYADDRRESLGELFAVSRVLAPLKRDIDFLPKRVRIFIHPECLDLPDGMKERVRLVIHSYLRQHYG